jgi:hypothetical protein
MELTNTLLRRIGVHCSLTALCAFAAELDEADLAELKAMLEASSGGEGASKPAGKRSGRQGAGRPAAGRADVKTRLIPKAGAALMSFDEAEGVLALWGALLALFRLSWSGLSRALLHRIICAIYRIIYLWINLFII